MNQLPENATIRQINKQTLWTHFIGHFNENYSQFHMAECKDGSFFLINHRTHRAKKVPDSIKNPEEWFNSSEFFDGKKVHELWLPLEEEKEEKTITVVLCLLYHIAVIILFFALCHFCFKLVSDLYAF